MTKLTKKSFCRKVAESIVLEETASHGAYKLSTEISLGKNLLFLVIPVIRTTGKSAEIRAVPFNLFENFVLGGWRTESGEGGHVFPLIRAIHQ